MPVDSLLAVKFTQGLFLTSLQRLRADAADLGDKGDFFRPDPPSTPFVPPQNCGWGEDFLPAIGGCISVVLRLSGRGNGSTARRAGCTLTKL
jgi:hypothetical protein